VYDAGTTDLSTIFSDDSSTALANPFTAQSNGLVFFYAADGRYDVQLTGGGLSSPLTLYDNILDDAGSNPLIAAIAALSSNGLITRTSSSTAEARTIASSDANIAVANGDGVSGNPTLTLGPTLTGQTISGSVNTLTVLAASQLSGAVPLANGGTGEVLADPGADRIMFWDNSAAAVDWLTAGTGLSISGTTLSATNSGTIEGSGTANTIAKFDDTESITDSGITDDATTIKLARNTRITSGALSVNGDFTAQAQIHAKTTNLGLILEETDAASNEKVILFDQTAGVFALKTMTDAYGAGATVFTVDRNGTALLFMAMATRLSELQGADVVAANNLVLGTDGNTFEITGATQINLLSNLSWQNGAKITLLFASTPTVKHAQATSTTNITILLAGAVDFVASAGDTLTLVLSEIGGTQAWREISRAVI
jgi:hypothetical protein